ncbi:WhiB family transcription factor [Rhodococcus phage Shagrat]|nr:WhiB family transcription factor [Rhodococcus phage Shagrat]
MARHEDAWVQDALCLGKADEWDADKIEKADRPEWAYRQCRDCPVLLACAAAAIRDEAVCVLRAGIVLPQGVKASQKRLQRIIDEGGPRPVRSRLSQLERAKEAWERCVCECCQRKIRPPWGHKADWPDTVPSRNRSRCTTCYIHPKGKPCPTVRTSPSPSS